jgi:hypothetical protein
MDTRFWGPSGWRLLHLVAEGGFPTEDARLMWLYLPYVLPCKFCRASLSEYYKKYPVPTKGDQLPKWLWQIHNCVNAKLRLQGLPTAEDPPFELVHNQYNSLFKQGCTRTEFPGWIFLFCIADNHPSYGKTTPMPDVPEPHPTSLEERNQYNLLTPKERLVFYKEFFQAIPHALPYSEWRESWFRHSRKGLLPALKNRSSLTSWLWKIHCGMNADLKVLAQHSYFGICKALRDHRSGCGKDKKAKTCRKNNTRKKSH